MTIPDIFSFFISRIFDIWNWLDDISLMGQFSMLDFLLAIIFVGGILPAVLNIRTSFASSDIKISSKRSHRKEKDDD